MAIKAKLLLEFAEQSLVGARVLSHLSCVQFFVTLWTV